ncbi:hypothetical protein VHEMI02546 [[Torrubiella] hemipterigena]|uniref:Uncharacterized protein n=1 Tax=[Torrubiella] hemipterigena TaxID=1531966 RepID=A0A0A1SW30_9HYPO|nr:hypothetical protein VHEMI02546 [[Torrubiella] hemipterigena]
MAAKLERIVIDLEAPASPAPTPSPGTRYSPIKIDDDDEEEEETNTKSEWEDGSQTEPALVRSSSASTLPSSPEIYEPEDLELPRCKEAVGLLLAFVQSSTGKIHDLQKIFRPILHKHYGSAQCPIVLLDDDNNHQGVTQSDADGSNIHLPKSNEAQDLFMKLVFADVEEIKQLKKLAPLLPDPSGLQLPPLTLPLPRPVTKVSAKNTLNRSPTQRPLTESISPKNPTMAGRPHSRAAGNASRRVSDSRVTRAQRRPAVLQSAISTISSSSASSSIGDISYSESRDLPSREDMFRNNRRVNLSSLDDILGGMLTRNRAARESTRATKQKDMARITRLGDQSVADWTPSAARLLVWSNQIDHAWNGVSPAEDASN